MKTRVLPAVVLAGLAASGCGLKGPLFLPEKSEVTIRPAPKPAAEPAAPAKPATPGEEQAKPEQPASPAPPPQDPQPGPGRG